MVKGERKKLGPLMPRSLTLTKEVSAGGATSFFSAESPKLKLWRLKLGRARALRRMEKVGVVADVASVIAALDVAEGALLSLLDAGGQSAIALAALDIESVQARQAQFLQQLQLARDKMLASIAALNELKAVQKQAK